MKLQLTLEGGTLSGKTFDLETGFLTVGRGETCSVRFDPVSERIASKQHAFIEAKADGYYLTDNQSTNGTLLNGELITTSKLSDGDQIQFGRNGVTARAAIRGNDDQPTVMPDNFRDLQVQQFNQIAEKSQSSVRDSVANIGLGSIAMIKPMPQPSNTARYFGIGATLAIAFCLVVTVGVIMWLVVGLLPAIAATFIAFIPASIYILPLLWLDRYDPEPSWLIAIAFGWGALVAVVVSFFVNSIIGAVATAITNPNIGELVMAVVSAPIFEEGTKGIGVVLIMVFFHKYFDDILDGIVFAGLVALGFATVENILYYGRQIGLGSPFDLLLIFGIRGILSPFAHVMFTSMTGIGCGISRESHKKVVKIVMPFVGYIAALVMHAIWNGFGVVVTGLIVGFGFEPTCGKAGLGGKLVGLCGFFTGYIVIEVPLFLIIVCVTFYMVRRQRRILTEMLAMDVARGLVSQDQVNIVTSVLKSSSWLISGLFSGKYWARSRFMRAVAKLGLSYWHIQRATAAHGQTASFQQNPILRDEVIAWREQI